MLSLLTPTHLLRKLIITSFQKNRWNSFKHRRIFAGIKDVKTVNKQTTLGDLGMDSLMGAEIKQALERHFDILLSAQEIRTLTFASLESISAGDVGAATQTEVQQFGDDQVSRLNMNY